MVSNSQYIQFDLETTSDFLVNIVIIVRIPTTIMAHVGMSPTMGQWIPAFGCFWGFRFSHIPRILDSFMPHNLVCQRITQTCDFLRFSMAHWLTGPCGLSACVLLRVAARDIEQPTSKFN
jgi:hypothetical protein